MSTDNVIDEYFANKGQRDMDTSKPFDPYFLVKTKEHTSQGQFRTNRTWKGGPKWLWKRKMLSTKGLIFNEVDFCMEVEFQQKKIGSLKRLNDT